MAEIFYETHHCPDPDLPLLIHQCVINSDVLAHWHTNIELLYLLEGELSVTIDGADFSLLPGEIILINSNCLHTIKTITPTSHYRCMIIEESFTSHHQLDYTSIHFQTKITDPTIFALFLQMIAEIDQQRPYYKSILQGLVLQMTGTLFRVLKHNQQTQPVRAHSKVELTKLGIDYISHHYRETIFIDDICTAIGVSKFHFCRVFKEVTELTVNEFINHFRCTRAQTLLLQKDAIVADCALACGFNDPSYFSKTYRKHFGYLPSEEMTKTETS